MSENPNEVYRYLLEHLGTPVELEPGEVDDPAKVSERMVEALVDRAIREDQASADAS